MNNCKGRMPWRMLLMGGALLLAVACRNNRKMAGAERKEHAAWWTCPMHPDIIRDKPGSCPVCGMDLVKKTDTAAAISGRTLGDLLQPADRFVLSAVSLTAIHIRTVQAPIPVLGMISYDTRLINTIAAAVSGRIEKIYVRYRYQHVHKGDRIMDIYSPELVRAQQEWLFLLKNDPGNTGLIDAARQKLLLLGMDSRQLQQVQLARQPALTVAVYSNYSGHLHEAGNSMPVVNSGAAPVNGPGMAEELPVKEGMYVQRGETIFQLYNTDQAWVLLNIFPGDRAMVKPGDAVTIIPETDTTKAFHAKIDFIEPFYRKEDKTLTARVYFNNARLQLPVGSRVRGTISGRAAAAEWLPASAVISLGYDKAVFMRTGNGFTAHAIQTGYVIGDSVQVISGLQKNDSVAVNAQFLMDSESFIKTNN